MSVRTAIVTKDVWLQSPVAVVASVKKAVAIPARLQVATTPVDVMIVSKHVVTAVASHAGTAAKDVVIVWVLVAGVWVHVVKHGGESTNSEEGYH